MWLEQLREVASATRGRNAARREAHLLRAITLQIEAVEAERTRLSHAYWSQEWTHEQDEEFEALLHSLEGHANALRAVRLWAPRIGLAAVLA